MDRMLEQVQNGDFDPEKMFTGNKDKFLEVKTAIESISNNLTKETCAEFLKTKIIPTVFDKNLNNEARDEAIEIGLHLLQFANISHLSTKEQENVFNLIEEKYVKTIGDLRDNNYPNWDQLWIFLVKLCHTKLHTNTGLANKLLRIVEMAFRNSTSIEQRLKAYDCWSELIDNCSLNMDHMCSAKQIKLLVTPMKAKFSRMPVVIMKRCDTFVYLLEKLQDKATLCLKEFLEFCFGPFEEKNDAEKMRQGKSVSEVCVKSTKVLIEIIGHSHGDSVCIKSDDIKLYKCVIHDGNFSDFADILISSVIECCILTNEWNKDSSNVNCIIKCLWRSLLNLIHHSNDETKNKCTTQINSCLRKLLGRMEYNTHILVVLGNIVDLLIKDELIDNLREIVFDIIMNLLRHIPNDSCLFNVDNALDFINSCFEMENGIKFGKIATTHFKNDVKCLNPVTLSEIWLKCNITVPPISNLIWPIHQLHNFKNVQDLNAKWSKVYASECKSDVLKFSVMQEIEKLFLENPLLSCNVISFLQLISTIESNPGKDFVAKFMRLIELVLTLPNLSEPDIKKLSNIILIYCDQKQNFYKSENNDEALDKLCGCLEHIVTIHKNYAVLMELAAYLKESQPKTLAKFSKHMMSFLETLMLNEDIDVVNSTRKIIELLETKENEPEVMPLASTRSLRIINMANVTPKATKLNTQTNNLRLFGKDVEVSSSPVVKDIKLGNSPKKSRIVESKKKKESSISINDDKSSDYVKIDSEVKIDLANMSEHQKEVLRKRREDIPALYQDLTQTQTYDSVSNSHDNERDTPPKENTNITIESPNDEKKKDSPVSKKRKRHIKDDDEEALSERILKLPRLMTTRSKSKKVDEEIANEDEIKNKEETKNKNDTEEKLTNTDGEIDDEEKKSPEENVDDTEETNQKGEGGIEGILNELGEVFEENKHIRKNKKPVRRPPKLYEHSKKRNKQKLRLKEMKKLEVSLEKNADKDVSDSRKRSIDEEEQEKLDDTNDETNEERRISRRRKKSADKYDNSINKGNNKQDNKKYESMEELLARIDKRIEEKRKVEEEKLKKSKKRSLKKDQTKPVKDNEEKSWDTTLPDGNQNKINSFNLNESKRAKKNKSQNETEKSQRLNETENDNLASENPEDVYKFYGDEESTNEDLKKSAKKKKKSMYFNRSDYVSKRKKRTKKDKDNQIIPFHVTADCSTPLPLSKSQTLRAVAQESETITILITRSPPNDERSTVEEDKEISQIEASDDPTPKRRSRRKRDSDEVVPETEEIIESSQEPTPINLNKRKSLSDKNKFRSAKKDSNDGDTSNMFESNSITKISKRNKSRTPEKKDEENKDSSTESLPETLTAKEETQTPSDKNVYYNTPVKGIRRLSLTETLSQSNEDDSIKVGARRRRCRSLDKITPDLMNSLTANLNEDGVDILPKSDPNDDILGETLTCEAISQDCGDSKNNDTLNLTADNIKDDLPSSPVTCDTPDRTQELLNNTSDISPINASNGQTEVTSTPAPKHSNDVEVNWRVARLLNLVNSKKVEPKFQWLKKRSTATPPVKVRKMRMKKEENLDILTFSREVPSPLVAPASGILKRKFNNMDETATPSPKRKRVNFSDPAITEKKIIIKDAEEYETNGDDDTNMDSTKESDIPADIMEDFNNLIVKANSRGIGAHEFGKVFLNNLDREEMILTVKEFCDSIKDMSKIALKRLIENLKVPEIVEIVSDYLINSDDEIIDGINMALVDNGLTEQILDKCVVPLIQNSNVFEIFLPKILDVIEKLSDQKLKCFVSEIVKVFGENQIKKSKEEAAPRTIEDHVINNFNCDKMNDLIKEYFMNLPEPKRNDFLVNLINFASSELPVNREFVNCHVNVLQNFVKRMTD